MTCIIYQWCELSFEFLPNCYYHYFVGQATSASFPGALLAPTDQVVGN